ncbi:MAG: serine/threonine-protein kinase [Vulcanimicrobiota bacterium]
MVSKLRVGDEVSKYKIVKILGRGDFSTVYLAQDSVYNKKWIIKEIEYPIHNDEALKKFKSKFTKISKQLASLKHKGIVKIVDYFISEEGNIFLVREYLEGRFLNHFIGAQRWNISESRIRAWVAQIFDIIEYLHGQDPKVIMGVIVPSNIIITPMGRIRVMDLGLTRYFSADKQAQQLMKISPGFVAPELVARQMFPNEQSDVYSVGVLLHYLLSRIDPNNSPFDLKDISLYRNDISHSMTEAVNRAINRSPAKRFNSIAEFREAIFGSGESAQAPTTIECNAKEIIVEYAPQDQLIQGNFDIKSNDGSEINGVVIPKYSWLKVYPERFSGENINLKFWIDTAYMQPGSVQENSITIKSKSGIIKIPVKVTINPGMLKGMNPAIASFIMLIIPLLFMGLLEAFRRYLLNGAWLTFLRNFELVGKPLEEIQSKAGLINKMTYEPQVIFMGMLFALLIIVVPWLVPFLIGKFRQKLTNTTHNITLLPALFAMLLPSVALIVLNNLNVVPLNITIHNSLKFLELSRYLIPFVCINLLTLFMMILPKDFEKKSLIDRNPGLKLVFFLLIFVYFIGSVVYYIILI